MNYKFIPILLFILFMPQVLFSAHSIILKSGNTIKGQVIAQNEKGVTVKTPDGNTVTIEKTKILKVVYKDVTAEEEKRIRLEEERKLKAKEEAQKLKAEADEKKRLEEEAKKLAEEEKIREKVAKTAEEKRKANLERIAREGTRSEWDLVWRSAVLPGYGLYHGNRKISAGIYSGLFWGSLIFAFQAKSAASSAKSNYYSNSLIYQLARPTPIDHITPSGVNFESFFIQNQILTQIVSDSKENYRAKTNQHNGALGFSALIYIIQLTHSYIAGGRWVEEEFMDARLRDGFHFNSHWEFSGIGNEFRSESGYNWLF